MECFKLLLDHLAWSKHQFLSGVRDSRKARSLWGMMRGVGGVHQSWLAKWLGLGFLCWGFKGVQEEIPLEEANTLQSTSVAFPPGQCSSPQLNPCHLQGLLIFFVILFISADLLFLKSVRSASSDHEIMRNESLENYTNFRPPCLPNPYVIGFLFLFLNFFFIK